MELWICFYKSVLLELSFQFINGIFKSWYENKSKISCPDLHNSPMILECSLYSNNTPINPVG